MNQEIVDKICDLASIVLSTNIGEGHITLESKEGKQDFILDFENILKMKHKNYYIESKFRKMSEFPNLFTSSATSYAAFPFTPLITISTISSYAAFPFTPFRLLFDFAKETIEILSNKFTIIIEKPLIDIPFANYLLEYLYSCLVFLQ